MSRGCLAGAPLPAPRPACTAADHDALRADAARWHRLVRVGVMGDGETAIELRNCRACRSTLAREIARVA